MLKFIVNVIIGSKIRPKQVLRHQGKPWKVLSTVSVKPGKGAAFMQAKIQALGGGPVIEERFSSSASVELCYTEERSVQYLYQEGESYIFMDENSDMLSINQDDVNKSIRLMAPGAEAKALYCDDQLVEVVLPSRISCKVESEAPGTAEKGGLKYVYAKGLRFAVPSYISVGEDMVINSETCEFLERAKKS